MKIPTVAHITVNPYGGAGQIARSIHEKLLASDWNSMLITREPSFQPIPQHKIYNENNHKFFFFFKKNPTYWMHLRKFYLRNLPIEAEYFSLPFCSQPQPLEDLFRPFDILHLHWVSDSWLDLTLLFSLKNKKFIWSIHDMNPFTGGCHHSDDCRQFENHCVWCPLLKKAPYPQLAAQVFEFKLKALSQIDKSALHVVSPSKWLSDKSESSALMGRFPHYIIPNPVDMEVFFTNKEQACSFLQITRPSHPLFLFISNDLTHIRKGFSFLCNLLSELRQHYVFECVAIGNFRTEKPELPDFIRHVTATSDKKILSAWYCLADALLIPSVAENFPGVCAEALMHGTPVLAHKIGGIPEQVQPGCGMLIPDNNPTQWMSALQKFMKKEITFNPQYIRETAHKMFNNTHVISAYKKLYQSMLNS